MIGSLVGNYKIVEKLGEGGMGTVYRGVDQMVERSVAIKVLRSDIADNPEVVERFRSEAIALARLNHAAIAMLYSFFREGDRYFMAMEFVPGETLERKIQREGALPWQRAVEIMMWALDGVKHAHQMGILHRDLKPANIMITPDGRVKVTDFGIARVLNTMRLTREARVVGTLEYLAPERALGRPADARSDAVLARRSVLRDDHGQAAVPVGERLRADAGADRAGARRGRGMRAFRCRRRSKRR